MSQDGWKPPTKSRSAKGIALLLGFPGFLCTLPLIIILVIAIVTFIMNLLGLNPVP